MNPKHRLIPDSEKNIEDKKWIEASKIDIRYFEPLYDRYFEVVFRFLLRRTNDEELAADLCSQTFLKALSAIKSFQWKGKPFVAWLYTIAGNELRKHFRKKKDLFVVDEYEVMKTFELEENDHQEKLLIVMRELEKLQEIEIRLIELKYFEGATFGEISDLLELKESAVKMKLYRAIEKVKKSINHDKERL